MCATRSALRCWLLAALLLAFGAAGAGAVTICVQDPACPAGGETQPTIAGALALAANGAHPGRDRIQLGPTTVTEAGLTDAVGNIVDIVGSLAGAGQTTIAAPVSATPSTTLTVSEPASTVSDVEVRLPLGTSQTGLALAGTAQDVTVLGVAPTTGLGLSLGPDATFAQGIVALPLTGTSAVSAPQGKGTLQDSAVAAETGVTNVGTIQRVRITAVTGIQSIAGALAASVTVDDALVSLVAGSDGTGLAATQIQVLGPYGATLTARHVTVVGNGRPGSVGVKVNARGGTGSEAATASATVSGTILRGLGSDLSRIAAGGVSAAASATANLTIDYSDYDPLKRSNTVVTNAGGTHGAIVEGAHSLNADPGFVNPGNGDYALRAGSPLIDRGNPAPLAAGEPTTDIDGKPRVLDGNGDGVAVADVGAFEAPAVPLVPVTPPAARLVLGPLSLTHTRFAVTHAPTAVTTARQRRTGKRPPRGTIVHFTLSRAATVKLRIERLLPGRRSHGRCAKSSRALRRAKRCTRHVFLGTLTRHGSRDANAIPFTGHIGHRTLRPGRYRFVVLATAGAARSKARTARFSIVRS